MKKTLFLIIISLFFKVNSAQPYNKLLGNETYWYVTSCFSGCLTDFYFAKEDTLINSLNYKLLDGFHYNRNMMVREDTLQRKVYFRSKAGYKPNTDILIYDFSLTVGDTIDVFNPNSPLPNYVGVYRLDSITNKALMDGVHRVFHLSETQGTNTTYWIEGVGSTCLINTPSAMGDFMGAGDLSCFYKDGVQVFQSDTLPNGPCDTSLMVSTVQLENNHDSNFEVYPNPSYGIVNVANFHSTKEAVFKLFDITGKELIIHHLSQSITQLNLETYPKGIYFYRIVNDKERYSGKLIVQ